MCGALVSMASRENVIKALESRKNWVMSADDTYRLVRTCILKSEGNTPGILRMRVLEGHHRRAAGH